jgi:predicted glycosyltransferase involved in capsule biosynthesis
MNPMEIPKLSIVTHVYNQPETVARHVEFWKSLDPAVTRQIEFICVDDFSDSPLQIQRGHLNLRLFRVTDDIDWNMPGCKNLGALMARADWLLFFDIDALVDERGLASIVGAIDRLNAKTLYNFRRTENGVDVAPHINTLLMSRDSFFLAGGLDEDFSGHYGYEDVHFHHMWRHHVGNEVLLTDIAFQQLSARTESLDRDTTRNQALVHDKIIKQGHAGSVGKLRFRWIEQPTA